MYDQLFESLLEYFDVAEAGWIHPNGQIEVLPNYLGGDHDKDAFRKLYPGEDLKGSTYSGAYSYYLKQGHIRFIQSGRGLNIELRVKPTESQMRVMGKLLKEGSGEFYFSIWTGTSYGADGSSWKKFREEVARLP